MKRKDKIAAGMVKPPLSKFELKRRARYSDSPFAVLGIIKEQKDAETDKA